MARLVLLASIVLLATAPAADWSRFRGPNGSGISETTGLPVEFGPGHNVVWKTPLPPGHSSPILSGDRIFLTGLEGEKLYTLCLRRENGEILWRRECPRSRAERLDKRNSPASPTPAADGENVYVFFPDFGLLSYDWAGSERWRVPLGPFDNVYGMGASPILAGDQVVLVCDQRTSSFVIAVGASDGKVRWRTPRPEALSGHSTPIIHQPKQGPLQILAPGSFRMDAYSSHTGESVWWVRGLPSEMKSTPVLGADTLYIHGFNVPENDHGGQVKVPPFHQALAASDADKDGFVSRAEAADERLKRFFSFVDLDRDGRLNAAEWNVYIATMASENALLAIRLGDRGDVPANGVRWKYHRSVPQLPSPLLYQDVLYMINDGGILTTLDPATGTAWKQGRLRGAVDNYFASPVAADGKVYFASQSGIVTVLKAGPGQELLAVNHLDDECHATPAIADSRLYVRTRSGLYCFASPVPRLD